MIMRGDLLVVIRDHELAAESSCYDNEGKKQSLLFQTSEYFSKLKENNNCEQHYVKNQIKIISKFIM